MTIKPVCVCGHRKQWHPKYKGRCRCQFIDCECLEYHADPNEIDIDKIEIIADNQPEELPTFDIKVEEKT